MFSVERLRYQLVKHRMTQKDLAEVVGVTPVTICRYCSSGRVPRSTVVARMAVALGVSIDYLMGGPDPEDSGYADSAFDQTVRFIKSFRGQWDKAKKVQIISELIEEEISE